MERMSQLNNTVLATLTNARLAR